MGEGRVQSEIPFASLKGRLRFAQNDNFRVTNMKRLAFAILPAICVLTGSAVHVAASNPGPGSAGPRPAEARKIIIDTDPGTDDALAILLALNSPELQVEAITVVPGNVTAEQGLKNALRLVSLAGRCDIPVAGGAQHPLAQKLVTAEFRSEEQHV